MGTAAPAVLAQAVPAAAAASSPAAGSARAPAPAYLLSAEEILGFQVLLNRFNRYFGSGRDDYRVTLDSIRTNLHSRWVTDDDPFETNQLGHPYAGATYFGFARSSGLDFWTSAGYAVAGGAVWEIAGERTLPSRND